MVSCQFEATACSGGEAGDGGEGEEAGWNGRGVDTDEDFFSWDCIVRGRRTWDYGPRYYCN